jgi:uncharacterized RDD family membrane protein YckC
MPWFYKDGETEVGPIEKADLQRLINTKKIDGNTLIRSADAREWKPLAQMVKSKKPRAAREPATVEETPAVQTGAEPPLAMESRGAPEQTPPPQPTAVCSQCGRSFPRDQVLEYEGQVICGACKPMFIQRMREGVSIDARFNYGGFWIRFAAKLIDGILLTIVSWAIIIPFQMILFSMFIGTDPNEVNPASFFIAWSAMMFLILGFQALYATWFVGRFAATPGKMACKLKIVLPDGGKLSYKRAFGRYLAELVTGLTFTIGYIIAAFDDEKRSLHDRIASTRVVEK